MFVVKDRQIRSQALGSGDPERARPAKVVAGKPTILDRGTLYSGKRSMT
jgi:hypothetical protein